MQSSEAKKDLGIFNTALVRTHSLIYIYCQNTSFFHSCHGGWNCIYNLGSSAIKKNSFQNYERFLVLTASRVAENIGKYTKVLRKYWGVNLGKRIKQASKSLYLADSFMTPRSLCQELAQLGPLYGWIITWIKPCNSSSRKQTRFRGNQIHVPLRHLDVLTVYSSCELKTRQDER